MERATPRAHVRLGLTGLQRCPSAAGDNRHPRRGLSSIRSMDICVDIPRWGAASCGVKAIQILETVNGHRCRQRLRRIMAPPAAGSNANATGRQAATLET